MFYHIIINIFDFLIIVHTGMYAFKRLAGIAFYAFLTFPHLFLCQGILSGKGDFMDFLSQCMFGIGVAVHIKNFGMVRHDAVKNRFQQIGIQG